MMRTFRKNKTSSSCAGFFLCLKRFCNETSLHGFNHIGAEKRHPLERLFWLAATSLGVLGAVYISYGQWRHYNDNPTVVILEKDFRNWNYSFPGLTVCFKINFALAKSKAAVLRLWKIDENNEKWSYYMDFVKLVSSASIVDLQGFQKYINDDSFDKIDLYDLAVKVAPQIDAKMTWHDNSISTTPQMVMTEMGVCHTLNSLAAYDILVNKSLAPQVKKEPITCQYKSHVCYFRLELQAVCVQLFFHSAYDTNALPSVVEAGGKNVLCPGRQRTVELSGLDTRAAEPVKELSVRRRGCLFLNEPNNPRQKTYSNNMCRRSCRNRLAINLCGCRPYFNEFDEGQPCNISGLVCLSQYSEELKTFQNKSEKYLIACNCPQQCEDSIYIETYSEDKIWTKSLFATQASVKYSIQAPRTRYKRVIVFYFHDLVVSLGGAAGLFLGASFLSFVEIVYFIIEALIKITCPPKTRFIIPIKNI